MDADQPMPEFAADGTADHDEGLDRRGARTDGGRNQLEGPGQVGGDHAAQTRDLGPLGTPDQPRRPDRSGAAQDDAHEAGAGQG
jgi:hypothetical protein